jgi:hypothetical protein
MSVTFVTVTHIFISDSNCEHRGVRHKAVVYAEEAKSGQVAEFQNLKTSQVPYSTIKGKMVPSVPGQAFNSD